MSLSGARNPEQGLVVAARRVLLDALEALEDQRGALVLIGAQAVYVHTGKAPVALAESTKDSDLAVDPRLLADGPRVEEAMTAAGFRRDLERPQPGGWFSEDGIPVDLMVAERLADRVERAQGQRTRRGVDLPPHNKHSMRRARGLEAAMVDFDTHEMMALEPSDRRVITVNVAGPSALLVAKLHKLGERRDEPNRLVDKDAHDVYRLLVAIPTEVLAKRLIELRADPLAGDVTAEAVGYLRAMFATAGDRVGAEMAGRAESLVGDSEQVTASTLALVDDLLTAYDEAN